MEKKTETQTAPKAIEIKTGVKAGVQLSRSVISAVPALSTVALRFQGF